MSYIVIKSISINKNNEVWINSAQHNEFKNTFAKYKHYSLSIIAKIDKVECIKSILFNYWSGEFQQGNNIYNTIAQIFIAKTSKRYKYNNVGFGNVYSVSQVKDAIYKYYIAYINRNKKNKYIIKHAYDGYVQRKSIYGLHYMKAKRYAKIFKCRVDAELFIYNSNSHKELFRYEILK